MIYMNKDSDSTAAEEYPNHESTRLSKLKFTVGSFAAAMTIGIGIAQAHEASQPVQSPEKIEHIVQPGETVWEIAEQVANPHDINRQTIIDVIYDNSPDLNDGTHAGDVAIVPEEIR